MTYVHETFLAQRSRRVRRPALAVLISLGVLAFAASIPAQASAAEISLTPSDATNPVGTPHTVLAHVIEQSPPGKLITFTVTGVNAGATGTCAPADCRTDADDGVRFTYVGNNAGVDTITARYVNAQGEVSTATARKLWVVPVPPKRNGAFSCRASGLNLLGLLEPVVANRPNAPCRAESASLLTVGLNVIGLSVSAAAVNASTTQTPSNLSNPPAVGDNATAHADTATALISLGISARATVADAKAECTSSGVPTLSASGQVVGLRVGAQSYNILTQPVTIPLLLATLRINATINTSGRITRRAVWLDNLLLPDVIISEAIANYSGNPCSAS